jgi:CRP-like cAMP-binding protein
MLSELARGGAQGGPQIVLTRVRDTELLEAVAPLCATEEVACVRDELDLGLEWCEQRLLAAGGRAHVLPGIEDLAQHQLCAGLSRSDVGVLESMVQAQRFAAGERIVCQGDAADRLYFLMRGEVSVVVPLHDGGHRRLSTLSPGMGFGEAALLDAPVRTADVRCDTEVECWSLSVQHFAALERVRPSLMIGVLRNLLRMASETAGRLTSEVAALES